MKQNLNKKREGGGKKRRSFYRCSDHNTNSGVTDSAVYLFGRGRALDLSPIKPWGARHMTFLFLAVLEVRWGCCGVEIERMQREQMPHADERSRMSGQSACLAPAWPREGTERRLFTAAGRYCCLGAWFDGGAVREVERKVNQGGEVVAGVGTALALCQITCANKGTAREAVVLTHVAIRMFSRKRKELIKTPSISKRSPASAPHNSSVSNETAQHRLCISEMIMPCPCCPFSFSLTSGQVVE